MDQARLQLAYTRTALALRLYLDDHGRLPEALQPLVHGGYLDRLPVDPFSGEPLKYLPREGRLYSVGDDGRDDGGETDGMRDHVERLSFVTGLERQR